MIPATCGRTSATAEATTRPGSAAVTTTGCDATSITVTTGGGLPSWACAGRTPIIAQTATARATDGSRKIRVGDADWNDMSEDWRSEVMSAPENQAMSCLDAPIAKTSGIWKRQCLRIWADRYRAKSASARDRYARAPRSATPDVRR